MTTMTKAEQVQKVNEYYKMELTVDDCLTTSELTAEYRVESFAYGMCFATKDGVKYAFDFTHMPRLYFNRSEL